MQIKFYWIVIEMDQAEYLQVAFVKTFVLMPLCKKSWGATWCYLLWLV